MKKILNISLVAVLAATPLVAHADIASTGYVTTQLAKQDTISELNDTAVSSPTAGQVLRYDATASKWKNESLPTGSSTSLGMLKADGSTITASSGTISVGTIAQAKVSGLSDSLAAKQDKLTAGTNITINSNGTISAQDTTYSTMGAATASAPGTAGLVPASQAGDQNKFLRADGKWVVPTNTTYSTGTATTAGVTKLYTGTGSSTDGTMTQKAISDGLALKQDVANMVTDAAIAQGTTDAVKRTKYPSYYTMEKVTDQKTTDLNRRLTEAENNINNIYDETSVETNGNYIKAYNDETEEGTVVKNLGYLDTAVNAKVDKAQGTTKTKKIAGTDSDGTVVFVTPTVSGSGNVVSSVSVSDAGALTLNKGVTALTSITTGTAAGSGTVVKGVSASGSTVTATMGTIGNADVADNAKIAPAKIDFGNSTLVPQVGSTLSGTTADGVYTLTATVSNGAINGYKWELISR